MPNNEPKQATWGGRFREPTDGLMARFSESVSFDCRLATFDLAGSQAHARMLARVGTITAEEGAELDAKLEELKGQIERGGVIWREELEDVHMNIEQTLEQLTPLAAKLHTGRSRNDQVATAVRLFLKDALDQLDAAAAEAQRSLLILARSAAGICIPGYTHLQRAQPVPVAHNLLAYVEMLERDRERFAQAYEAANVCPLGSGAIAGSTLPNDREFTARELGFVDATGQPRISRNSMDAVADRDAMLAFTFACTNCLLHLSRLAEDMILWASSEFAFVVLPDGFTTGSSLMPQKKNPDALELIRGKAARVQGDLTTLLTLVKGLPLTYNRDLQEDKPPLFDAFDQTLACLQVVAQMLPGARFRPERCAAAVADPLLLATDLADYLVERGVPFRQAHHAVGAAVAAAEEAQVPLPNLPDATVLAISKGFGEDWREVFSLERALDRREQAGMPGPKQVEAELIRWEARLASS